MQTGFRGQEDLADLALQTLKVLVPGDALLSV